jgi:hypothetical protein
MSIFIDRDFLTRISPGLQKFVKKKDDLYNFRCPICGDSQKNKSKSRGYVYRKKNDYFFMCHNCGAGMSFYNFLKHVEPTLVEAYQLERFKESSNYNSPTPNFEVAKTKPVFDKKLDLPSIASLPDEHFAKQYVMARKLPLEHYNNLYYAEDFKAYVDSFGIEKENLIDGDKRLIIPFHDKEGNLTGFQGRALGESKIRYITIKLMDDVPRMYGFNRINLDEKILVVEGPIDSMFLKNSVAVASSALQSASQWIDKSKLVLIFDNEPRNKEIVKLMEDAIDNHFNIVIWPEFITEKDINDIYLSGLDQEEIHDIIDKYTFVNLRAKMEFINWKKV